MSLDMRGFLKFFCDGSNKSTSDIIICMNKQLNWFFFFSGKFRQTMKRKKTNHVVCNELSDRCFSNSLHQALWRKCHPLYSMSQKCLKITLGRFYKVFLFLLPDCREKKFPLIGEKLVRNVFCTFITPILF